MDELDYRLDNRQKDEAIADFIKEVNTLKQVKDSKAKNINNIQEAFDLHSQLWIVSDYCSGGSVHTLMKACDRAGLVEDYIIPIARELAVALKHVHDAGVIHRDIKCGNVLVSEDGNLQLCDFGIAAGIENDAAKRSTIIGTPYWMAPEMHADPDQGYGQNVDCWAYGCTVFEMATGMPPYHKFRPDYLREVLKSVPRLEGEMYSQGLKDFVAFCLQAKPEDRPKAQQITEHPYIANTQQSHPTSSLRSLIDRYVQWERKGNQRMSLFNEHGAAAPQLNKSPEAKKDHWIFSTTDDYDVGFEQRQSRLLTGIAAMDFADKNPQSLPAFSNGKTPLEVAKEEQKVHRGEKYLQRLFDADSSPYDYGETDMSANDESLSDLPLRNMSSLGRSANRETLIDLDNSGLDMPPTFNFDFTDMPTVKANRKSSNTSLDDEDQALYHGNVQDTKRATKDWKFPTFDDNIKRATKDWKFPTFDDTRATDDWDFSTSENPDEKRATKDWTFPTFNIADTDSNDKSDSTDWTLPTARAIPSTETAYDNRKTMEWSFETAQPLPDMEVEQEYSFPGRQTQNLEVPAVAPLLTRTLTEPVPRAPLMGEQTLLTVDVNQAQNRESRTMIDLDLDSASMPVVNFGQVEKIPIIAATPLSPSSATMSLVSATPFDLEQDPARRADDVLQYTHKRQQGSASSMILVEKRFSRSAHPRKSSLGSQRVNPRMRNGSVDSTASSVLDDPNVNHGPTRHYNRIVTIKMRDQLRLGLQRSASETGGHHSRNLTDESHGDADTDGPSYHTADSSFSTNATNHSGRMHRMHRSSGNISYDTDSSIQDENIAAVQTPIAFPQMIVPHPSALVEGASQEKMLEELDKMLIMAEQAFGFTTSILRQREIELERAELVDSATESVHESNSHGIGFEVGLTSESEFEGNIF